MASFPYRHRVGRRWTKIQENGFLTQQFEFSSDKLVLISKKFVQSTKKLLMFIEALTMYIFSELVNRVQIFYFNFEVKILDKTKTFRDTV